MVTEPIAIEEELEIANLSVPFARLIEVLFANAVPVEGVYDAFTSPTAKPVTFAVTAEATVTD
jgi:hypothetical protein